MSGLSGLSKGHHAALPVVELTIVIEELSGCSTELSDPDNGGLSAPDRGLSGASVGLSDPDDEELSGWFAGLSGSIVGQSEPFDEWSDTETEPAGFEEPIRLYFDALNRDAGEGE